MPFPEEPLDSPVGYYPAEINQKIYNGHWTIIRKLGWGPRSSTWLGVNYWGRYMAVKIFTASATCDKSAENEQNFLYLVEEVADGYMCCIQENFYEESSWGDHLCLGMDTLNPESVEKLRLSNTETGQYLPMYMVQKIVSDILKPLFRLEQMGIIHGAIIPGNFLLWGAVYMEDIKSDLKEATPCSDMVKVIGCDGKEYLTVPSQPIRPNQHWWNEDEDRFVRASIRLNNFSYARHLAKPAPFTSFQTFLPPEALLRQPVDCTVDLWMLACSAYLMATGTLLFSDSYVYCPLKVVEETIPKLETLLKKNGKVKTGNVAMFCSFLRSCLVIDPRKRANISQLIFEDEWIQGGTWTD